MNIGYTILHVLYLIS